MIYELINREFGIVRLLSIGLDIYQKNIRFILAILVTINLPIAIVQTVVSFLSNDVKKTTNILLLRFVDIILPITASCLAEMAIVLMVERYLLGEKINYFTAMRRSFSCLLKFTCLKLKVSLGVSLGFLLFIIPGIIFSTNYYFFPQAFILRYQRGEAALSYSEFLVKGNWWKVFLFTINQTLITYGFYFLESNISQTLSLSTNSFAKLVVDNMLSDLIVSLFYVVNTLLFLNLDYRKNPIH